MAEIATMMWVLIRKDLVLEYRSRETILAMVSFALLVLAIFTVVLDAGTAVAEAAAFPVLWIGIAFAAAAGFSRSFTAETEGNALDAIRTTLVGRDLVLASKAIANFLILLATTIILLTAFYFFFGLRILDPLLLLVQLLVVVGFSFAGTMFGAIAIKVRTRQVLISLLFIPSVAPLIIAAVEVGRLTLADAGFAQIGPWLGLVAACDLLFIVSTIVLANVILDE